MVAPPPFTLRPESFALASEIMRLVGRLEGMQSPIPQPKLRKGNRVRTLLGTLAIEGNTLTLEQATAIVEGKNVVGPRKDILELQNAIAAYNQAATFQPARISHLLRAHALMMEGLLGDAGRFRAKGVGVFQGNQIAHIAPPATRVLALVQNLLAWLKSARPHNGLIASAVFHYELAFIHPFSDGNGRLARLWQHVILLHHHPIFAWIPVESVVRERQEDYYAVLSACDKAGESTLFIEFSLSTIHQALAAFLEDLRPEPLTATHRLQLVRDFFEDRWFSRSDYLAHFKTVATATASRDLRQGVDQGLLLKQGDKSLTRYRFT